MPRTKTFLNLNFKPTQMKKFFSFQSKLNLYLSAAAVVFLLQSCCLSVPSTGAKKPCNCNDKRDLATTDVRTEGQITQKGSGDALSNRATESLDNNHSTALTKEPVLIEDAPASELIEPVGDYLRSISVVTDNKVQVVVPSPAPGLVDYSKAREKRLPLGIKGITTSLFAGPNMCFKSSKEDYGNTDHKHKPGAGLQLGIGTKYIFSETFAVSTSLLFKQNNAKEVLKYSTTGEPGSTPGSQEYETKYSYSYLSAPILAEFKLSDQLTGMAGPELNYLLGASTKQNGYGSGEDEKTSITKSSVKFGAGVQLGLKYELPNSPLAIQLVYDHRLSRLNKKTESMDYYPGGGGGGSYETPAWNMKSIQLGIVCALCDLMKK
jgi:hypothetical protein